MTATERHARPRSPIRASKILAVVPPAVVLVACGEGTQSVLDPESPGASRISSVWWLMFGLGVAVYLTVTVLLVAAWWRRRQALEVNRAVVIGGVALPLILLGVIGVESVRATGPAADRGGTEAADIVVVGEQWWWRVNYPDAGIETANEVHIPAGEPVVVELRSADVIHSFWVPRLAGKVDLVPGRTNRLVLEADQPGTYRGSCAEYCGLQHANMRILVIAHEPGDFDEWLEARSRPPAAPSGLAAEGERVFMDQACSGCHRVEGTDAQSTVGPDLTDFGAREELGAGVLENNRGNLGGWIINPQDQKPGALMPATELTGDELRALLAYLEGLDPQ